MNTTETRLAAIAERAAVRRLPPDELGRFVRQFAQNGRLLDGPADLGRRCPVPADMEHVKQLRAAILDLEEAAFLAAGGDPSGTWCQLLDAAREGRPGADEQLRAHGIGFYGRRPGVLGQVLSGYDGCCDLAVAHPVPPEPETVPETAPARRRRR